MSSQPLQALALANEVRLANAETCRRIAAMPYEQARHEVASILLDPDGRQARLRVVWLLRAVPRVGLLTARRMLAEADLEGRESRQLRDLTARQREVLAAVLLGRGVVYRNGFAVAA